MYPDLDSARRHVVVPGYAEPFLTSSQAPILLLPRTEAGEREIAAAVAPGSAYLGVFLPYAPLPVVAPRKLPAILAMGGHFDRTFAHSRGREIIVSQHVGDLDTHEARAAYRRTLADFQALLGIEPELIACDSHPGYYTTELARALGKPIIEVQHHHAHMAACLLENGLEGEALGVSWDGTGGRPSLCLCR